MAKQINTLSRQSAKSLRRSEQRYVAVPFGSPVLGHGIYFNAQMEKKKAELVRNPQSPV